MSNQTLFCVSVTSGLRCHSSASQFTFTHTIMATSSAGQLRSATTLGAAASMATATAIFTISQNMNPNTAAPGLELVPLVIPRASKALGKTVAAAPYSADHAAPLRCVTTQVKAPHSTPAAAWLPTTRHGDVGGCLALKACASSGDKALK